jgi:hypothetical protein
MVAARAKAVVVVAEATTMDVLADVAMVDGAVPFQAASVIPCLC